MKRELGVYAVVLGLSLGAAYWASLPIDEAKADKVMVLALDGKNITEIRYRSPEIDVAALRRKDDDRFWITWQKAEAAVPAEGAADKPVADEADAVAEPGSETAVKVSTERFLGNEKMNEFVANFTPFYAERVIGKLDESQLEEFGLTDKAARLELMAGDQTFAFFVGKKSYGTRNRFVLEDGGQGRVLLIDDQGLENFERANLRLYERRVMPFELSEVSTAEVTAKGKSLRMAHTQKDKNGVLIWSDDEENASPKPSYGSWMDKIAKLRLTGFADQAQEGQLETMAPFLELSLARNGQMEKLSFRKLSTPDGKALYFVTSEFLKAHGQLVESRAQAIEKDIDTILGDAA